MKISITNIVALNGGDAAIVYGMAKTLKSRFGENIELKLFASHPSVCQRLYPDFEWQETLGLSGTNTKFNHIRYLGRIARIIKKYRYLLAAILIRYNKILAKTLLTTSEYKAMLDYLTSDYIISTGGTYLIEPYGITTQILDYNLTLTLGRKLGFYTQSMGPFTEPLTIKRLKNIFDRSNFVFLRDNKSKENLMTLKLSKTPTMKVVADAAFALGNIYLVEKRNIDYIGSKKKVAISVRRFIDKKLSLDNYCQGLAETIKFLIDKDYEVYFFSTCQGIPEYDDDSEVVTQVLTYVSDEYKSKIINITKHISIPELLLLLEKMDFIIATRLHMSILSLIVGTPVFPIAYEFKSEELFHMLGYNEIVKMEDVKNKFLVKKIEHFVETYDFNLRLKVNEYVISLIKESMEVAQLIQ